MKTYLLPLFAAISLGLSACSSVPPNARVNYVPPSVVPVTTSVSGAQTSISSARKHADIQTVNLAAAHAKATAATENVIKIEGEAANLPVILGLAKQAHKDLDELTALLIGTTTENAGLITDLDNTRLKLQTALTVDIPKLKADGELVTNQLNERGRQLNEALAQGEIDKKNAHTFKAIIIGTVGIALVCLMFGLFSYAAFAPPLLYVTLGAPAAASVFLFFWLGSK